MAGEVPRWSGRPLLLWFVGLSLVVGGLGFWLIGTPQYSLICLGRSIAEHDLPTFQRYVDTRAVVDSAVTALMDDANELIWGPADASRWQTIGRQLSGATLNLLRPKLQELAQAAVDRRLTQAFLKLDSPQAVPPRLEVLAIEREGRVAIVKLQVEGASQPVRIVLEQGPDRRWRVVVVDQAFLKRLILQERQSQLYPGE